MRYFFILLAFLIFSCTYQKGLLSNGMSEKERRFFIVQNGGTFPVEIKDHFMRGIPCDGMYVDMIFHMYGEPNFKGVLKRDSETNNILEYKWTYYAQERKNSMDLKIIVELVFDEHHNVTAVLGNICEIIGNCPEYINSKHE